MEEVPESNLERMSPNFVFPDLEAERGEIERVAATFAPDKEKEFVEQFIERAKFTKLVDLTEELWQKLENTDSFDITLGGWDKVNELTIHYNTSTNASRSFELLKTRLEQGETLNAPIIVKVGDLLHLVAGNTRLMTSRALGIMPKVLMVEM